MLMCSNILPHYCTVGGRHQQLFHRPAGVSLKHFYWSPKQVKVATVQFVETVAVLANTYSVYIYKTCNCVYASRIFYDPTFTWY